MTRSHCTDAEPLLQRLLVAVETAQALPEDVADWLLEALHAFERGGRRRPLCTLLGLHRDGKQRAREQRLEALQIASGVLLQQGRWGSPRRCAEQLAEEIRRFERTPGRKAFSELDKAIADVIASGARIPTSGRQVARILEFRE